MEAKYLVLGFFQLVLRVSFKLISDTVNRGLRAFEVFPEEDFEVRLRDRSSAFMMMFALSLIEADGVMEK